MYPLKQQKLPGTIADGCQQDLSKVASNGVMLKSKCIMAKGSVQSIHLWQEVEGSTHAVSAGVAIQIVVICKVCAVIWIHGMIILEKSCNMLQVGIFTNHPLLGCCWKGWKARVKREQLLPIHFSQGLLCSCHMLRHLGSFNFARRVMWMLKLFRSFPSWSRYLGLWLLYVCKGYMVRVSTSVAR